jgi:hypothetical protein
MNCSQILFRDRQKFLFVFFFFCQSKIIQMVERFSASNNEVTIKSVTEGNSESAQFSSQH